MELRDKTDNTQVVGSTSALLQLDGDIVNTDDVSDLEIGVRTNDYFVVVKHHNHLGIMSSITYSLTETTTSVNFTDSNNQITNKVIKFDPTLASPILIDVITGLNRPVEIEIINNILYISIMNSLKIVKFDLPLLFNR